jgi:dephospho-CoA kinase
MGMGKSETARLFAEQDVPVFDADAAVHAIYAAPGSLGPQIEKLFSGAVTVAGIDRAALSAQMTPEKLERLEALIHPRVRAARDAFLARHEGAAIVVFDIPLLLETGTPVDAVVVATAPAHVQKERILARPGMTEAKFAGLAARQMSDAEKRSQAHYVVMTDQGLDHAREQVKMILADIRKKIRA